MKPRILIIYNDIFSGNNLKNFLVKHHFEVNLEDNLNIKRKGIKKAHYNLCIIENDKPGDMDFRISVQIKANEAALPVLFISEQQSVAVIIKAFQARADDFISPYDKDIMLIKINKLIRTADHYVNYKTEFSIGKFVYDASIRHLNTEESKTIKLTPKENELLKLLVTNTNEFISRSYALKLIWGKDDFYNAKSMNVYIWRLRKHLKQDANLKLENIYNSGFRLTVKAD